MSADEQAAEASITFLIVWIISHPSPIPVPRVKLAPWAKQVRVLFQVTDNVHSSRDCYFGIIVASSWDIEPVYTNTTFTKMAMLEFR